MTRKMKQVSHTVFYNMADEEKEEYKKYIENKIKREKEKKPLLFQLMNIMKQHVKRFQSDFYLHDYNAFTIDSLGCKKFIWSVYDCGTRLVRLENEFEEDMNSSFMYFRNLRNTYFKGDNGVYLVDLKEGKVTTIKPEDIREKDFSHTYGKTVEYFNKRLEKLDDTNEYRKMKDQFEKLMVLYKSRPPKTEIDAIFTKEAELVC